MDDINTQLHGIEVGCSWCKVSSIGHHKLTRPTNISIRRRCCREQIIPPAPSTKEWYLKENMKRWRTKIFYRPAFWKCCLGDSQSTGHVLSLNTNNFWSQQLKFIQQTSEQLCHCQDLTPPSSKYDTISLVGNIQMISYCKLTMTQMSCQLSHFNISHWILWHLCQSAVTVTQPTLATITTPGPRATARQIVTASSTP